MFARQIADQNPFCSNKTNIKSEIPTKLTVQLKRGRALPLEPSDGQTSCFVRKGTERRNSSDWLRNRTVYAHVQTTSVLCGGGVGHTGLTTVSFSIYKPIELGNLFDNCFKCSFVLCYYSFSRPTF